MKNATLICIAAAFILAPGVSHANGWFERIEVEDTEVDFVYDGTEALEIDFRVDVVVADSDKEADIFVTAGPGNSGDFDNRQMEAGGETLNYQVFAVASDGTERTLVDMSRNPDAGEVLSGTIQPTDFEGERVSLDARLRIPQGQSIDPNNTFQDQLNLTLYIGNPGDADLEAQDTAVLTIVGPGDPSITVSLVDPGDGWPGDRGGEGDPVRYRELDFGVLEPGAVRAIDLLVDANTSYSITAESENNGALTAVSGGAGTIPYTFFVNSDPYDLSSGPVTLPETSGFRFPLEFVIDGFPAVEQGEYSDTVNLTVTTQ